MNQDIDGGAKADRDKGSEAEQRFFRIMTAPGALPDWIKKVHPSKRVENNLGGADFIVTLKDGRRVPVNVKSSASGKKLFVRRRGAGTACVIVVKREMEDEVVKVKAIAEIQAWIGRHMNAQ